MSLIYEVFDYSNTILCHSLCGNAEDSSEDQVELFAEVYYFFHILPKGFYEFWFYTKTKIQIFF